MKQRGMAWGMGWGALCAAAFVAGCGGGAGEPGGPQTPNEARLQAVRSGELVGFFRTKVAQRVAAGLPGTVITLPTVSDPGRAGSVVVNTGTPLVGPQVEEDGLVKADGTMLYALHRAHTTGSGAALEQQPPRFSAMARLPDHSLRSVGRVALDETFVPYGFYVAGGGTRAAVISQQDPYVGRQPGVPFTAPAAGRQAAAEGAADTTVVPEYSRTLSLDVFSIGKDVVPAQLKRMRIDGLVLGSRLVGNTLYIVTTWSPDLTRFTVPAGATAPQLEAALKDLKATDILPTLRVDNGQPQLLVTEADCLLQPGNASLNLQLTTITAIDLASSGLARTSRCFAGGSEGLYLGASSVYVASSRQYRYGGDVINMVFPVGSRTDIHKFALRGGQVDYSASGVVDGHLGWDMTRLGERMNEYQGDLRVVTFTGQTGQSGAPPVTIQSKPVSTAVLSVLRDPPGDSRLALLAKLPIRQRLSPTGQAGQQIDTVHFAGARGYAATFLPSDPVYVLDLANASNPSMAGEIAAQGYTRHLFALPGGWLLGVGRDVTDGGTEAGVPLALFDVRNPAQTRRVATDRLGIEGSSTALGAERPVLNVQQAGPRVLLAFPARAMQLPIGIGTPPPLRGLQGAARWEVNTTQGTLTQRSMLVTSALLSTPPDGGWNAQFDLFNERSLQVDAAVYQISGGQTFYKVGD
ncbi:beta-propeller domain-containing protein [Paracidovorax sp. MALMAid1276]|uniref:beta-propeller domain-containing protein n=1 Tax=Paracidovorax sp. MALMAid1276 TaxID=3411631 RepID=UPI003B9C331C